MAGNRNPREVGDRIERLLDHIRSTASPPMWQRVEELVRSVVDLYGEGLKKIVEVVATAEPGGEDIANRLLADELVESLFLLHGLHPDDFATRVANALRRVRPYLGSHGGDIELVSVDEASREVRLRLSGSCDGCPSSILTVKLAVEGAIREAAPEVTRIDVEGVVEAVKNDAHLPPGIQMNGHAAEPSWVALTPMPDLATGTLAATELPGVKLLLCRVEERLYAYRDGCPACGAAIVAGELAGDLLTCPSCAERYDVRLAGRSIRHREFHLEPIPLLEDADGIRIALGATA
jgi:Fe-S cluster biogenesis protein NfuA/nitrite reductase/ring-hydroxylating ferredoxin subunit